MNTIDEKIPSAPVDEAVDFYRAFQDSHHDDFPVYAFDGIPELLAELRKRGCLIGVGTSRTEYSFTNYIESLGLGSYFDEIVTVNDVSNHKPHPETIDAVLLKLMSHDKAEWEKAAPNMDACENTGSNGFTLNTYEEKPSFVRETSLMIPDEVRRQAIMIGDTKYDIGCANNAGIDSVLVGWSHYVDEASMAADGFAPTHRISKPEDLLALIL